mmetsp:Transcript_1509/g.3250  ORF Transcript_1509/g.3250 Transcript_1509/m.3250 type:complete len:211 (+) Transcript_1509:824-1456(+)
MITTIELPISILNPRDGVIFASLIPIAIITLYPYMMSPDEIPTPPSTSTQRGTSTFELISPASWMPQIAASGPTEFATSFAPCARESNAALTTCKYVKNFSVFAGNFSASSCIARTPSASMDSACKSRFNICPAGDGDSAPPFFSTTSSALPASAASACAAGFSSSTAATAFRIWPIVATYTIPVSTAAAPNATPTAAPALSVLHSFKST